MGGSGSGMNNPDDIFESLETIFWVKILKFFDADPGWKKVGSGIGDKHPDLQHCFYLKNLKGHLESVLGVHAL